MSTTRGLSGICGQPGLQSEILSQKKEGLLKRDLSPYKFLSKPGDLHALVKQEPQNTHGKARHCGTCYPVIGGGDRRIMSLPASQPLTASEPQLSEKHLVSEKQEVDYT